jgi:hypothetical protein
MSEEGTAGFKVDVRTDGQGKSHTYSSAYYNAVMSDDFDFASKILSENADLEYLVEEK